MFKISNSSLIALFLLSGCFESEHDPYVRIHSGNLEVASKSFLPKDGNGPKVTLLGAVHIGEQDYYKAIQKRLDAADRVLFERVGSKEEAEQMKAEVSANCPENLEWMFPPIDHDATARVLGLTQQMGELDYNRAHFVHADMSMREFVMSSATPGSTLCEVITANKANMETATKAMKAGQETFARFGSNTSRNVLGLTLSKAIGATRENADNKGTMNSKLVLFDRNDVAMAALRPQLSQLSSGAEVVVFYGAAHMKDLEKTLNDLGYQLHSTDWLKAFSL